MRSPEHHTKSPEKSQYVKQLGCSNYRGIKLIWHTLKLVVRIIDQTLRTIVEMGNIQFGFRRGRSTMEAVFALKVIQEKYKEKHRTCTDDRRLERILYYLDGQSILKWKWDYVHLLHFCFLITKLNVLYYMCGITISRITLNVCMGTDLEPTLCQDDWPAA